MYLVVFDYLVFHYVKCIAASCPSVLNLTFHGYFVNHVEEVVNELVTNNLYCVRINHPIIDAVGILSNEVGDKC